MTNYVRRPVKCIGNSEGKVLRGEREILTRLRDDLPGDSWTIAVETYPGVNEEKIRDLLEALNPDMIVSARQILKDADALEILLKNILTEDRVFGRMYYGELADFIDPYKAEYYRTKIESCGGKAAVYG